VWLCIVVLGLSALPAWAGAPTEQLRGAVERIIRVIEDPGTKGPGKSEERRAAIRREADGIFDFEEMSRRTLGPHWRDLDARAQREFVPLFADLLARSYISRIEQYSGEQITYAGDSVDGDLSTVRTRFITKKGTEVPVDYRMVARDGRWRVYDVNIEGVSLVANYRTQFNKIIRTGSYQTLVAKLKEREGEFAAPGAATITR
jgi:phospholipid transport system substrate-binding protein